ncbi:alpha-lytic protease prodomain-containing protein [Streptomyces sioyaensis]|uniref:alpha-lytic protease prodomain-containing protein n=1 Tax=Streptomyces sioyaensis TaxID=67364 RepID=UPI001EEFCE4E|nr:alpha-lytic protease prodomain-containing protein [Streptomyces sioyaensis]
MRRDLGLTAAQVRTRLAQEADAHRSVAAVRRALSAPPAGMWFDKSTGRLVVAVTGAADAQRVRDVGAVPRTVPHSRAALTGLMRRISGRAGGGVPGVTGWGVDERANGVVLRVARTRRGRGPTPSSAPSAASGRARGSRSPSSAATRRHGSRADRWWAGSGGCPAARASAPSASR